MDAEETIVLAPYGTHPQTGQPYPPHATQQKIREWVQTVRHGEASAKGVPVLYCQHGVNSGGTRGILTPLIECLLEYPDLRVLVGRKDYNDLRLSVMETFREIVPSALIAERDEQEHRYVIDGQSGQSTVFFRELKDVKGLGSQEFAIITVHEAHEIDLFSYRTLKQRCRQRGYPNMILMEGNPPSHGHWLTKLTDSTDADYDPDITVMILSSEENWSFMAPAYRESLSTMPEAWKRRYLLGQTAALPEGTPVYPSFVESVHVQPTSFIPDRPILRFWDFGLRRAACAWAQQDSAGRLLMHREWMPFETPEEQFIDGVITRTNLWFGSQVCRDFGDPAATHRDPDGVSTLRRLLRRGIALGYRQTTYGERIPLVNRKLCELISGQPAVAINPLCQALIEGLAGGYHYPKLSEGQEFSAKRDLPFKDSYFEHIVNAMEYGVVNLFMGMSDARREERRQLVQTHREHLRRRQGVVSF